MNYTHIPFGDIKLTRLKVDMCLHCHYLRIRYVSGDSCLHELLSHLATCLNSGHLPGEVGAHVHDEVTGG